MCRRFESSRNSGVARVHDLEAGEDSYVDIRIPGRLRLTFDPETNTQTFVLTGHILLIPETPGQAASFAAAGLPELPLIKGRVVLQEQIDPENGPIDFTQQIVSYTPNVTDVCALLPE